MECRLIDLFEMLVKGMSLPGDEVCATFHRNFHNLAVEIQKRALRVIQEHYPEVMSQIHDKLQQA
ncbi:hypothetical protein CL629_01840 [bacterium]|nr:hypothetical protein [bacterium]